MTGPDIAFWQQRFDAGQLPWDRGTPSPQLEVWLADGTLTPCRIAVPGCGTGHEVAVLAKAGFEVTAIDYARGAISSTRARLHPDHWAAYALQLQRWLRPGGRLALLAMQALRESARQGQIEGPPYHVDINALRALLPESHWQWPRPPYKAVPHPANGWFELALALTRR